MASDLHLDPDRLHVHGWRLTAILDALVPTPGLVTGTRATMSSTVESSALVAELDRMTEALDRACQELAALGATLHATATAASTADADAARAIADTTWRLS